MLKIPFSATNPPETLCILRTSAIGDVTHIVPLIHTLRAQWPRTKLTWVIGKLEQKLVGDIAGVEFMVFDKALGVGAFRALHAQLKTRRFDVLLHMQVALRANLVSTLIHAPIKIGYDEARSKDLHRWFINRSIPVGQNDHVLDALASFIEPLGLQQTEVRWDIPIPDNAHAFAQRHLPGDQPTLLISPCSSHRLRNWRPQRYAAVADFAAQRLGLRIVLCGGPSAYELKFGEAICSHMATQPLNLIGKDTLKQLLALLKRAHLVLTPDSGPMHMANAVGTPVLGLHAASNPARSGPYSQRRWCVDRYDAAARKFRGKSAADLPWGTKLEYPDVMDLIEIADVTQVLERFAAEHDYK